MKICLLNNKKFMEPFLILNCNLIEDISSTLISKKNYVKNLADLNDSLSVTSNITEIKETKNIKTILKIFKFTNTSDRNDILSIDPIRISKYDTNTFKKNLQNLFIF